MELLKHIKKITAMMVMIVMTHTMLMLMKMNDI